MKRLISLSSVAAFALAAVLLSSSPAGAADAAAGEKVFKMRCAMCHGQTGKGDGPAGKALKPPPRDFSNAEWQAGITDEQIKETFLKGGAAVGKSPTMPPHPDLKSKADDIVAYIRSLGGK